MIIDDKTIIQAIRGRTEVGFKLLMQKYKQPIYWHIRRLVVSHDDAHLTSSLKKYVFYN